MEYMGVQWFPQGLHTDMKEDVYEQILVNSTNGEEPDIDTINAGLAAYDDVDASWGDRESNRINVRVRATRAGDKPLVPEEGLFAARDLDGTYVIKIDQARVSDCDYYLVRMDDDARRSSGLLVEVPIVGSVDYDRLRRRV